MPRKFRESRLTDDQKADADRLAKALQQPGKSQAGLAKSLGVTPAAVGHWIAKQRPIVTERLPEIAMYCGVEVGDISPAIARRKMPVWRHVSRSPGEPARAHNLPIKARVRGVAHMNGDGQWRWAEMSAADGAVYWNQPGCYALRVMGDAMHPRYKSGEYVVVNEEKIPEPDDDVLVVLTDGTAMIRELASVRDGQIGLRGLRGTRQTIAQSEVYFMHKIVGRADHGEVSQ